MRGLANIAKIILLVIVLLNVLILSIYNASQWSNGFTYRPMPSPKALIDRLRRINDTLEGLNIPLATNDHVQATTTIRMRAEDKFETFHQELAIRHALLRKQCDILRKTTPGSAPLSQHFSNVIVMPESDILWCPVFKASSSSWLKFLLDITHTMTEAIGEIFHDQAIKGCDS